MMHGRTHGRTEKAATICSLIINNLVFLVTIYFISKTKVIVNEKKKAVMGPQYNVSAVISQREVSS